MNFIIYNSDRAPLIDRGYRVSEEHQNIIDRKVLKALEEQKGKAYAENKLAAFADLEPICMGEDGVFYTVLYDEVSIDGEESAPTAVAWREIEVINY